MVKSDFLLTDDDLQQFLVDGYMVLLPSLPNDFHGRIYDRLNTVIEGTGNPRNNILPEVPELQQVFGHPQVVGALTSILGKGYYLNLHRHCHDRSPGSEGQQLHQDSLYNSRFAVDGNRRHHHTRWAMAFYYPQDTDETMGPTSVVPSSHYLNENKGNQIEKALTGKAGTVVIVHYDIWHRATEFLAGDRTRFMVKFLFTRMEDPVSPSWNHQSKIPEWRTKTTMSETDFQTSKTIWDYQWNWHRGTTKNIAGRANNRRLEQLAEKLSVEDESIAVAAAYELGTSGTVALPFLIDALKSNNERIRRNAAYGFFPVGKDAVGPLTYLMEEDSAEVRARVMDVLGDLGPAARGATASFVRAMGDQSSVVRAHAVEAVGTVYASGGDVEQIAIKLADALSDENDIVRRNAALAIARIGDRAGDYIDRVADALAIGLSDDTHYVRGYSVLGLRRLATNRAYQQLLSHLESSRWEAYEHPVHF